MSNELTERLRRAACLPSRELTVAQLTRETRRHRQRQAIAGATLGVLVLAAALVGFLTTGGGSGSDRDSIAAMSSAPPLAGRTVSATPSTGLQDGQSIVVRGSGYAPGAQLALVTCGVESQTLANKQDACAVAQVQYASADAQGQLSTSYIVQRTIETAGLGRIDCGSAPKRCRLGVGELRTQEGASALLSFSTEAPPATHPILTLGASTGLTEGSTITVHGSGFGVQRRLALRQCVAGDDCTGYDVSRTITTDTKGDFATTVTLHQKIGAFAGDEGWCATNCLLTATALPEPSKITADSPTFSLVGPVPDGGSVCKLATLQASYAGLSTTAASAHALKITLKNPSRTPCWLNGYPSVQLFQMTFPAGGVGYGYGSSAGATPKLGDASILDRPSWVRLDPQGVSQFVLVKDDCAAGNGAIANAVDLTLPGESATKSLQIPAQDGALALPTCDSNVSNVFHVGPFTLKQ